MIKKYYYPCAFLRDIEAKDQDVNNLYQDVIKMVTQLQKEIPIAFYPQEPNQGGSLQDTTLINASTPKYMHIIIHT